MDDLISLGKILVLKASFIDELDSEPIPDLHLNFNEKIICDSNRVVKLFLGLWD